MCVENKQNYNGFIDICKFFMSILIVLGHYSYIIGQEFENVQIELNGIMGWCNVLLAPLVGVFFVISGWLIANNYSTKIEMGQVDFVDFMRERIKRIVPFAWFASTLFVVADLLYRLVYGHWWAGRSISISDAIMHFSETYVWIGGSRDINGPVWYISVLLFCYILFFVISRFVPEKYKICLYCFMILLGTYICLGGGVKSYFCLLRWDEVIMPFFLELFVHTVAKK